MKNTPLLFLLFFVLTSCEENNKQAKEDATTQIIQDKEVTRPLEEGGMPFEMVAPQVRNSLLKMDSLNIKAPYYIRVNDQILFYACKGNSENCRYETTKELSKGKTLKYGIVDTMINELLPFEYDRIYNPDLTTKGYIEIEKKAKRGLYNYQTGEIIACEYDLIFPPLNDEIAIGKIKNDYFRIEKNGKTALSLSAIAPYYKKLLSQFNFNYLDADINYLIDTYAEYYEGDPEQGTGVVVTPSYLQALGILPEIESDLLINKNGGFGIVESKSTIIRTRTISDKISAFVTSFYEEGIDGRGYQQNSKDLIVVNDSNNIVFKENVLNYDSYNEFYFCNVKFMDLMFINDSVIEVRDFVRDPAEYPKYRSMPTYSYYKIAPGGSTWKLTSNRIFDFTKYIQIDETYFKGCYSMYITPEKDDYSSGIYQLEHLDDNDLDLMRNEIFAEYGYRFKSEKWKKYFGEKLWYKARFDNVDSLLSPMDKHNLSVILETQKRLKANPAKIINKQKIEFGMAG